MPPPFSKSEGSDRPPTASSSSPSSLQIVGVSPSPPSFRQSMSPYMESNPSTPLTGSKSAANTTPTASWAPPKTHTFVNGRGNVQLASTPRDFVPLSPSFPNESASPGSTTPLMENRGQRTYLRSSPPSLGSAGRADGAVVFPSAFGVKQRINVTNRRGSMAAPSTSGPENSTGRHSSNKSMAGGSLLSSDLEYASRRVPEATRLTPLSISPLRSAKSSNSNKSSNRSEHSEPTVGSSRLDAGEIDTSDDDNNYESGREEVHVEDESEEECEAVPKPGLGEVSGIDERVERGSRKMEDGESNQSRDQSLAVVPSAVMSGLDIEAPAIAVPGRAGVSNPQSQGTAPPTSPATPFISYRPRSSRPDSFAKISPYQPKSPTSYAPESPKTPNSPLSSSIMNRSRPRTPAFYPSSEDEEQGSSGTSPLAAATYIKGHFGSNSVSSSTSTYLQPPASPEMGRPSILDRPRPRTPDPQSWLDSPETSSSPFTYLHTRGSPSLSSSTSFSKSSPSLLASPFTPQAPPQPPIVLRPEISSWHARMPSIVVPLNRTERRESMKPSSNHPLLNGGVRDSVGESSFAQFEASSGFRSTNQNLFSDSPLLDLDLGFSLNGVEGSMFDLDGLLNAGAKVSPEKSTFSPLALVPSNAPITSTRQAEEERRDWRTTSRLSMDSQQSKEPIPRSLPRKEPPKVDLKLELELEIDAAIRETRGTSSEEEVGSSLSTSLYNPAASLTSSPISPSLPKFASPSILEFKSYQDSARDPSPNPKRRHRRSLSSLLSLVSPTISSQSAFLDEDEGTSPKAHARHGSHSRFMSSSAPSESFFSLLKPADKSLPPTPTEMSFQNTTTYQPTNFSEAPKASGSSLLGRQLSRIRSRPDSNVSQSTGSSFILPKKSHKGPSASISSTQSMFGSTSSQIGRLVHRFKSKPGSQSSPANVGTSSPSTTTSAARYRNDQRDEKRSVASKTGAFLLGMSLPSARKSEDLLARPVEGSNSAEAVERNLGERRSFDLLTQAKTIERRPSTDNLLVSDLSRLSLICSC